MKGGAKEPKFGLIGLEAGKGGEGGRMSKSEYLLLTRGGKFEVSISFKYF